MATTLDESEVTEYREMFEMFDRNGDGVISTQEVKTVLKTLGLDPSAETVTDLIEEFDDNGNGNQIQTLRNGVMSGTQDIVASVHWGGKYKLDS